MQLLAALSIALVATTALRGVRCASDVCSASENPLPAVVEQLNRSHDQVDAVLRHLGELIVQLTINTITTIDADRDRILATVRENYSRVCIADEALPTVVLQASQQTSQYTDRKRSKAFECVLRIRDAMLGALETIDRIYAGRIDAQALVVLAAARRRVLRHQAITVEWIRDYTETNIAATIKGVLEAGKTALELHDLVVTTEAAQRVELQRRTGAAVDENLRRIVAIYAANDAKIVAAVRAFAEFVVASEVPEQAVRNFVNDSKFGVVGGC